MTKLKIEHTRRREGGTIVGPMPSGTTYHFKPSEDDPRHIAEVESTKDLTRFLSVGEDTGSFVLVDEENSETSGERSGGGGAKGAAPETPGTTNDAPVAETKAETTSDTSPDESAGNGDGDTPEDGLEKLTEDELRALFEDEIGRKAHHNAKSETLIAQIRTAREEATAKND